MNRRIRRLNARAFRLAEMVALCSDDKVRRHQLFDRLLVVQRHLGFLWDMHRSRTARHQNLYWFEGVPHKFHVRYQLSPHPYIFTYKERLDELHRLVAVSCWSSSERYNRFDDLTWRNRRGT